MECPICYDEIDVDSETLDLLKNNNECNIIHPRRIESDTVVKLVCGHVFHYKCLETSLKKIVQRNSSFKKRWGECPYCRSFNGYIPLLPRNIPIKGVHKEFKQFEKNVIEGNIEALQKYLKEDSCGAILKSGNNKGCQCPKLKNSSGFCPRHEKLYCPKIPKID